ncbi:12-oxophytodienoate reductase [Globisporangium polare]
MAATDGYKLFTPLKLGEGLTLKNRIVFAPMTRARSDPVTHVPSDMNATYYEQRAGAGLIITEATSVSEQGHGWYGAPALYNEAQLEGWKKVVDRVHAKDGKIFLQMWHIGRQGHSSHNAKNDLVSASDVRLETGHAKNSKGEYVPFETPRPLRLDEIPQIAEDFRLGAELAKRAGFDGIELHSANGYLFDQFFQTATNKRTDMYGGTFENRARFLFAVLDAIKKVWPIDRVAVRLAPNGDFAGMGCEDNAEFFTYLMEKLSSWGLAYLAILDGEGFGYQKKSRLLTTFDAKKAFKGTVLANNSYVTRDLAEGVMRSGAADFVSFGRIYISNPDLAERFKNDWPLAPQPPYEHYWDPAMGAVGYIDYPAYTPPMNLDIAK